MSKSGQWNSVRYCETSYCVKIKQTGAKVGTLWGN